MASPVARSDVGSVNLGIFLSSFARTELQVMQFVPLVVTSQALMALSVAALRREIA